MVLGQEKRKQVGELASDGQLRFFNEEEIAQREKETYFTKIFGGENWTWSIRK